MNIIFLGTIANGKLLVDHPDDLLTHLHSLEGKRVEFTVERQRRKRTLNQNAWYWGVAVKLICEHTGHEPDEVHDALKHAFSPKVVIGNLVAVKSTKTLDTVEFGDNMMDKVVRWAAEELSINIPYPNEVEP